MLKMFKKNSNKTAEPPLNNLYYNLMSCETLSFLFVIVFYFYFMIIHETFTFPTKIHFYPITKKKKKR